MRFISQVSRASGFMQRINRWVGVLALAASTGLLLLPASPAWAAVVYDNTAQLTCSTSPCNVTITVGSGSNRAIMVGLGWDTINSGETVSGAGATGWAAVAGTDANGGSNRRTVIWAAKNPASGSQTVTVTWSGSNIAVVGVVTASGVDQTTPVINGISQQVSSSNPSLTITSAVGDMTMDTLGTSSAPTLSAPTQTQRWNVTAGSSHPYGGSTGNGAATVTHAWTLSGSATVNQSGADFKAAAAGPPAQLAFSVQPSNAAPTVAISPAIQVQVQDASGALVTTATNSITLAIGTNPAGGTLSGTLTVAAVAGVATFSNISIDKSGGYTLTAAASGLTGATSSAFNITLAPFASVGSFCTANNNISSQTWAFPTSAALTAGNLGVIVLATDNLTTTNGNTSDHLSIIDTAANTWTKAREFTNGQGTAAAGVTVSIWYSKVSTTLASGQNITADWIGTSSITAKAVTCWQFTMGATSTIAVETGADKADTGVDASGITLSGLPNIQHLFIRGTGAESATTTYTASTNYTAFTHTSSTDVQGSTTSMGARGEFRILTATTDSTDPTASGLKDHASTMVALKQLGLPAQLAVSVQPSNAVSTVAISPAIQVQVQDANGSLMTTATDSITLAIGTNPGGGTLSGTLTVAAVGGVATFSNISIDKAGTGYTLTAAASGLAGATSSAFNITAGAAAKLAFTTQPGNGVAGSALATQPVVTVQDAGGNTVTAATNSITLAIGTNPGGGTLTVTTNPLPATSGVATFAGVTIDKAATGYTLGASATGLTPATSASFDITPTVTLGEVSSSQNDATSTRTWAHITSGTNRLLVVGVSWTQSSVLSVSSVTYNNVAMTSIGSAVNAAGAGAYLFYLPETLLPVTGTSATVSVTLSGTACNMMAGAVTFTGVNQSTPVGTFASATGTSAAPSVNVTSNIGETVIDIITVQSTSTLTAGGAQTQRWQESPGQCSPAGRAASSTEPGASSNTMSWTSGSAAWAIGAVGIKPAATCSSVPDATYVVAETQGTQATVYWKSTSNPVLILQKTTPFSSEAPSGGASYNVNDAIGAATVVFKGTSGTDTSFTQTGLTAGTTYYYKVFPKTGLPCYAPGIGANVSPTTTGAVWGYSTAATSMAPPALDPWSNSVVLGSNDNDVHGMSESDGTLKFAPFATGNPIQARPATLPAFYRTPAGSGVNIAYVTSQDGFAYAVDTSTGLQVWKSPSLAASTMVQGGPGVWIQKLKSLSICGVTTSDVVFVGTKDTGTTSANKVYALNGSGGDVTSSTGGNCAAAGVKHAGEILWTYTGGGANPNMDIISSTPYVDYPNNVLWVTSRAAGGTGQPSVWKLNASNGTLAGGTPTWNLGDIDSTPVSSADGAFIYVGTNIPGTLKAIKVSDGTVVTHTPASTAPCNCTGAGPLKGMPWPLSWKAVGVATPDTIIFSRNATVHSVNFNGSTFSANWTMTPTGAPATVSTPVDDGAGNLYIGGSDGKMHRVLVSNGSDAAQVPTTAISGTFGDATYNYDLTKIHVGATDGHIYTFTTPF